MKRLYLLPFLSLVIWACAEKKTETSEVAEVTSEVVQEMVKEDGPVINNEATIPSYNFEAFEQAFLNKEDDLTYVVNFWATWCKPCVKELPAFEELNTTYKDKKVKVVLASLDFPEKLESHVIPFVAKRNLQSEVVLLDDSDANYWIPAVSKEWSGAIPATLIVKNGIT